MEQYLGWVGTILFIYGVWAVGVKRIDGFYANAIANLMYVGQSILMNNWPLFWLSIGLIILNIKGIYEWSKKPVRNELKHKAELDFSRKITDLYIERIKGGHHEQQD